MDEETQRLIELHNLAWDGEHTDLQPTACECKLAISVVDRPPQSSGNACFVCGGITVQSGTCTTCTNCGSQGGCG